MERNIKKHCRGKQFRGSIEPPPNTFKDRYSITDILKQLDLQSLNFCRKLYICHQNNIIYHSSEYLHVNWINILSLSTEPPYKQKLEIKFFFDKSKMIHYVITLLVKKKIQTTTTYSQECYDPIELQQKVHFVYFRKKVEIFAITNRFINKLSNDTQFQLKWYFWK